MELNKKLKEEMENIIDRIKYYDDMPDREKLLQLLTDWVRDLETEDD